MQLQHSRHIIPTVPCFITLLANGIYYIAMSSKCLFLSTWMLINICIVFLKRICIMCYHVEAVLDQYFIGRRCDITCKLIFNYRISSINTVQQCNQTYTKYCETCCGVYNSYWHTYTYHVEKLSNASSNSQNATSIIAESLSSNGAYSTYIRNKMTPVYEYWFADLQTAILISDVSSAGNWKLLGKTERHHVYQKSASSVWELLLLSCVPV